MLIFYFLFFWPVNTFHSQLQNVFWHKHCGERNCSLTQNERDEWMKDFLIQSPSFCDALCLTRREVKKSKLFLIFFFFWHSEPSLNFPKHVFNRSSTSGAEFEHRVAPPKKVLRLPICKNSSRQPNIQSLMIDVTQTHTHTHARPVDFVFFLWRLPSFKVQPTRVLLPCQVTTLGRGWWNHD